MLYISITLALCVVAYRLGARRVAPSSYFIKLLAEKDREIRELKRLVAKQHQVLSKLEKGSTDD